MTEQEWLQGTDLDLMLDYMRGKTSVRKVRLFAVACCRRIWHIFIDHKARSWIDIAERLADGLPVGDELTEALRDGWYMGFKHIDGYKTERSNNIQYHSIFAACDALEDDQAFLNGTRFRLLDLRLPKLRFLDDPDGPLLEDDPPRIDNSHPRLLDVPLNAAWAVAHWLRRGDEDDADSGNCEAETRHQLHLAYDIFGNPFRPVALDPACRPWREGTIVHMAQSIYSERRFQDLPMLADALEEAGCTDARILAHCRGPGEHVRGCWVVDLVLGKNDPCDPTPRATALPHGYGLFRALGCGARNIRIGVRLPKPEDD
jgi:hypothetical protein